MLRLLAALLLAAGVVAFGGFLAITQLDRAGPHDAVVTVVLPRGIGAREMGERLAEAGALRHPLLLPAAALIAEKAAALKHGEYRIPAGANPRQILALLAEGKTVVRQLTVPEGLTVRQVLALVGEAEGLQDKVAEMPAEGTLAPETYNYSWGDARADMVARMRRAQAKLLADLWAQRAADLPLASPHEALVLASIVERETGLPEERPRVAAVFINRLKKGMKLQSDPTVIYGLSNGLGTLDRPLSPADLQKPTPHNTYVIDGLPPTPIANPGRAALQAVVRPSTTDELYFVTDGSGGHAFARTLDEHNRNVRRLRERERQKD
jgi:UPF0755 protein